MSTTGELSTTDETAARPRHSRAVGFAVGAVLLVAFVTAINDLTDAISTISGRALLSFGGGDARLPLDRLPQLLQADLREGAHGTLADLDLGMRILGAAPSFIHAITVVAAALLLVGILNRISLGHPFSAAVLRRWRWLPIVLLAGGALQAVIDTVATVYLGSHLGLLFGTGVVSPEERATFLGGDYVSVGTNTPQWPIPILLAGVIALALAIAFRSGSQLAEEADGVV
jgi:hypothetical protein